MPAFTKIRPMRRGAALSKGSGKGPMTKAAMSGSSTSSGGGPMSSGSQAPPPTPNREELTAMSMAGK